MANDASGLQIGVFDHIEHLPGVPLDKLYEERLEQVEALDRAGYHTYFVAEHHTPALHAMAPSQNVFLAAASQRTQQIHLGPGVYVLPIYHPLRLIEEICMLDNLTKGRMEIGVGRGSPLEAFFWGQEHDDATNRARFEDNLTIIQEGLSSEMLNFKGRFINFEEVPMRLRPRQQPYPPFWYMRNSETAAKQRMNCLVTGTLDQVEANVRHYRKVWAEAWGEGAPTVQGRAPLIGSNVYVYLAETDAEAAAVGGPAYESFSWNLGTPRRIEAERRGMSEVFSAPSGHARLQELADGHIPEKEMELIQSRLGKLTEAERAARDARRHSGEGIRPICGTPDTLRTFMDEYMTTGSNYICLSFQFGDLTHEQAMKSQGLFTREVMPHFKGVPTMALT